MIDLDHQLLPDVLTLGLLWLGLLVNSFAIFTDIQSALMGAIIGSIYLVLAKKNQQTPIPFGPYLVIVGGIGLFWGKPITNFYLTTSGLPLM